jgi:hypothetical protein
MAAVAMVAIAVIQYQRAKAAERREEAANARASEANEREKATQELSRRYNAAIASFAAGAEQVAEEALLRHQGLLEGEKRIAGMEASMAAIKSQAGRLAEAIREMGGVQKA